MQNSLFLIGSFCLAAASLYSPAVLGQSASVSANARLTPEAAAPGPGNRAPAPSPEAPKPAAKAEPAKPTFTLKGRVMTGVAFDRKTQGVGNSLTEGDIDKTREFFVRQLRVGIKAQLADKLRLNVSFDLADGFNAPGGFDASQPPYIRTGTLEYRVSKALRFTAGRFKRPFSGLEQQGAGSLPIIGRGLLNSYVIESGEWGDRAIGVMASGKLKTPKLRWALAVTNPLWRAAGAPEGYDAIARVQYSPLSWLKLGANGGRKQVRIPGSDDGNIRSGFAMGGDIGVKTGGASLHLEATQADMIFLSAPDPEDDRTLTAFGFLMMASYRAQLSTEWAVRPVAFAEYADADDKVTQNESIRLVGGINLMSHDDRLRIMPQFAYSKPIGEVSAANPWDDKEQSYMLLLSLGL